MKIKALKFLFCYIFFINLNAQFCKIKEGDAIVGYYTVTKIDQKSQNQYKYEIRIFDRSKKHNKAIHLIRPVVFTPLYGVYNNGYLLFAFQNSDYNISNINLHLVLMDSLLNIITSRVFKSGPYYESLVVNNPSGGFYLFNLFSKGGEYVFQQESLTNALTTKWIHSYTIRSKRVAAYYSKAKLDGDSLSFIIVVKKNTGTIWMPEYQTHYRKIIISRESGFFLKTFIHEYEEFL